MNPTYKRTRVPRVKTRIRVVKNVMIIKREFIPRRRKRRVIKPGKFKNQHFIFSSVTRVLFSIL